jgi:hypothetical protein
VVQDLRKPSAPVTARPAGPSATALAALFKSWGTIAGPALAAHVRVLRADGATLLLAADHPVWATKIRLSSATIVERVERATGYRPGHLEVVIRPR